MILLDTHILIWWISDPEKLSKKARSAIEKDQKHNAILVSAMSVWELYLLVKKGRLQLNMDIDRWLERVESLPFIQCIPVDNRIAAKSITLPGTFHDDPADRIIIATAREHGAVLITSDTRIRKYTHVQTIW